MMANEGVEWTPDTVRQTLEQLAEFLGGKMEVEDPPKEHPKAPCPECGAKGKFRDIEDWGNYRCTNCGHVDYATNV